MRVDPPEWWIGAGGIGDIVWDTQFADGFDPAWIKDIDLGSSPPPTCALNGNRQVEGRSHSESHRLTRFFSWSPMPPGAALDTQKRPPYNGPRRVAGWPLNQTCHLHRLR
jgi:hypothetical protein